MPEPTIKLELSIEEVNLILEALGDQPFKAVFALVGRLQSQARQQLGDATASSATATATDTSATDTSAAADTP